MRLRHRNTVIAVLAVLGQLLLILAGPVISYCRCGTSLGCSNVASVSSCCSTTHACCDMAESSDPESDYCADTCDCLKLPSLNVDRSSISRTELEKSKSRLTYLAALPTRLDIGQISPCERSQAHEIPMPVATAPQRLAELCVWLN